MNGYNASYERSTLSGIGVANEEGETQSGSHRSLEEKTKEEHVGYFTAERVRAQALF